jgi:hypothetical protein
MAEYKLNKKEESNGFYTLLPTVYPTDLQESLQIFENIRYKSYGFGMVFLDYNYTFKYWSVAFRNAANFTNPDIKAETPIEAVHQMLDFLKKLKPKG